MRFNEFRIVEAEQPGYYTVGDSHAVGMANYAGRPWTTKGKNGTSSTDSMHPRAIDSIPAGSVVVISAGANDTFARNPNPERIASSVRGLVDQAKAKGLTVGYLLFPVGTRDNKEAREKTREAIRSTLSGVTIIDLEGSRLVDGVHADASAYKSAANSFRSSLPTPTGTRVPAATRDPAADTGVRNGSGELPTGELRSGPPYLRRDREAVIAMQTDLERVGYSVGSTGADGRYGQRTVGAVRAYKKDNNIPGNGLSMSADELRDLKKAEPVENPTPTSNTRSAYRDTEGGNTRNSRTAYEYFIDKGLSPAQSAGIVGNLQAESGVNLNTQAVGDGGKAFGIAQWRRDKAAGARAVKFKQKIGKDVLDASLEEQLDFIWWELNNTYKSAFRRLKDAKTPEEAAAIVDQYYEQSSGAHRERRMRFASAIAQAARNTNVA